MDLEKDASFFIGQKLQQVCFGLYQIQLNFYSDLRIEVGHVIKYFDSKNKESEWDGTNGRGQFCINSLMEEDIISCEFSGTTLSMRFTNSEKLILFADGLSESYVVHFKKDFQVV